MGRNNIEVSMVVAHCDENLVHYRKKQAYKQLKNCADSKAHNMIRIGVCLQIILYSETSMYFIRRKKGILHIMHLGVLQQSIIRIYFQPCSVCCTVLQTEHRIKSIYVLYIHK